MLYSIRNSYFLINFGWTYIWSINSEIWIFFLALAMIFAQLRLFVKMRFVSVSSRALTPALDWSTPNAVVVNLFFTDIYPWFYFCSRKYVHRIWLTRDSLDPYLAHGLLFYLEYLRYQVAVGHAIGPYLQKGVPHGLTICECHHSVGTKRTRESQR